MITIKQGNFKSLDSITEINIPSIVKIIEKYDFRGCNNVKKINIA
ncbi:leucine-rich repeat protein, partial [Mycoplasmopsis fermentans]